MSNRVTVSQNFLAVSLLAISGWIVVIAVSIGLLGCASTDQFFADYSRGRSMQGLPLNPAAGMREQGQQGVRDELNRMEQRAQHEELVRALQRRGY